MNLLAKPQLTWLVDSVLGCDFLPVAWSKVEQRQWTSEMDFGSKEMNKLSSTERLRFAAHGDVPRFSNRLVHVTSEHNPMAAAAKTTCDILV